MPKPSRIGLLVLCLLLSSTAGVSTTAVGYFEDPVKAQGHATHFTADFLSSHFSRKASRQFDSKSCADRVYASERNRSLRYLFGPTMGKAVSHQKYLEGKVKSRFQLIAEFDIGFYIPFPAGKVYANLTSPVPAVNSSLEKSGRGLTAPFDAYISMPSPHVDRAILNDLTHEPLLEIVFFKTASNPKKEVMSEVSPILEQIKKTGLLEQGRQIRRQQMIATYLGKDHTRRTYSQRVLEDSKPRDGEEVYWLTLPEQSGPFYPGLFEDPLWTFELVIKFLTYAVPPLQESHDSRSRLRFFADYLATNGIIPGIEVSWVIQPPTGTSPFFNHVFVQSQKYHSLKTNSIVSVMSYWKSFTGEDAISPPIVHFIGTLGIIIGMRRTLLHGNETAICTFAMVGFTPGCSMKLSSLRRLKMPFRIPKKLTDEAAKRKEALRQLSEMAELNGLEESFDFDERALASAAT